MKQASEKLGFFDHHLPFDSIQCDFPTFLFSTMPAARPFDDPPPSDFPNPPCFLPQITGSIPPSCPARGALANVTNVGAGCGGRWPRRRARKRADVRRGRRRQNRVVLTPREQASSSREVHASLGMMVSKSRSPGRARHKPSNHCAGKAGVFPPNLSARVRFPCCPLHTRPRVRRAPGLPCALT